jgi:hypothetical protein
MIPDAEQAQRYRHRAIEIRIIADDMRDKLSRQILVGVAEDYERMAKSCDAAVATDASVKTAEEKLRTPISSGTGTSR